MRIGLFILMLLVGFWLRVVLHGAHGLEGDDGVTIHLLPIETETLIYGLQRQELDVHPPLYFVILQQWTRLTGDSLLALRWLNILMDILTGALLLRLVGRGLPLKAALLAGMLWLCAPLILFTLFPIRMYPLLGLFITGGAVGVMAILAANKDRHLGRDISRPYKNVRSFRHQIFHLMLLFLCTLAALYTHIFGALAAGAYALAFLFAGIRRKISWRTVVIAWGAIGFAGILFLPFGLPMLARLTSGSALGAQASTAPGNPWEIPGQLLLAMLTHRAIDNALLGTVIFIMLIVGGVYIGWRAIHPEKSASGLKIQDTTHHFYLSVLFILIGGMFGGAVLLAIMADIYRPRYVAPFVPVFLATLSGFIGQLKWRAVQASLILMLVIISGIGVINNLEATAYDDWRVAAQFLEKMAYPGDKIIIIPAWGAKAFGYHYQGDTPIAALLPGVTPDVDLDPILRDATAGHDRVWFVRYQVDLSDPTNRADNWFRERAVTITEVYPTAIQIKGYDFNPNVTELPVFAQPLAANFEDVLQLHGVDLPVKQGSGRDVRLHPPSNWIYLTLYLEKLQPRPNLTLRIRLTDVIGNTWGAPLERDNDLLRRQPLDTWQSNRIYELAIDLNLNPAIPSGDYYIEMMVLDAITGTALRTTGTDAGEFWAIVGKFTVTAGG